MKVIYQLEAKEEIAVESISITDIKLDTESADVVFQLDSRNIRDVKVIFGGLPINFIDKDTIDPYYPEKRIVAYKIFAYIANRILIQTSKDCFDPLEILNGREVVFPETEQEKLIWNTKRKHIITLMDTSLSISGYANLLDYKNKYIYADAYSNFADGIRAKNLITKYESFYKVVEKYFDNTGRAFDQEVSNYISRFDSSFTADYIHTLRILRNRCVHPGHRNGHISSDNVELIKELVREIQNLNKLARLLLENPPR